MLLWSLVLTLAAADGPVSPPMGDSECLGEVLELSLANVLSAGGTGQQLARERCLARAHELAPSNAMYGRHVPIGRVTLLRFHVAGAPLSLGLRLSLSSAPVAYHALSGPPGLRPLDELYVSPELRMPEAWHWALQDYVYTPALIGASAAIGTVVIWQMLRPRGALVGARRAH